MPKNEERRREICDAGLSVLAAQGARGLTHRAVDDAAGLARGTTSNYFRTREALIDGLIARIEERLTPSGEVERELSQLPPSRDVFAGYLADIADRLLANQDVTLALFELRLEASRRPEVAATLSRWQQEQFARDVAFTEHAQLPASRFDIALFHYAIEGLVFDRLTTSVAPDIDLRAAVAALAERLLSSDTGE